MPPNSRRKGAAGEREFIAKHLAPYWPEAQRNIDQYGDDKRDCIVLNGVHWQLKRTERLRLYDAIDQAASEARNHDMPVVAFRRNHRPWHCVLEAEDLIPLLRLRDVA
jgi:hypothetical protein